MSHACNHPTAVGDPCQRQVADDRDREHCFMHRDSFGVPRSDSSVVGAPSESLKGNQNAVGNSGGGPPEGNANAATHHGWSDPLKHYHRLAGEAREWVDELLTESVEHYALVHGMDTAAVEADGDVMDRLRALAAMHHQWRLAAGATFRDGIVVEREREYETPDGETVTFTVEVPHPALDADLRLSQRQRTEREDLGIDWASVRQAERARVLRERFSTTTRGEDTPRFE